MLELLPPEIRDIIINQLPIITTAHIGPVFRRSLNKKTIYNSIPDLLIMQLIPVEFYRYATAKTYRVLKTITDNPRITALLYNAFLESIYANNVELSRYIYTTENIKIRNETINIAVMYADIEVFEYLYTIGAPINNYTSIHAVQFNKYQILKYMFENNMLIDPDIMSYAALYNRMNIMRYLQRKGYRISNLSLSDTNNLSMMKYLYKHGARVDSYALERAEMYGHDDKIRYLYSIGCRTND